MKYQQYIFKRKIENIFIYPFVLLGKCIALVKPQKKEYQVFFFFPFFHTGGAEKVHALITQAVGNENCIIYFTKKSVDATFLSDFEKSNCVIKDISRFTDNKWLYFLNLIYRGIITGYINKQSKQPIVFNGQCNFGYKISPWVKSNIQQIELIHSFNSFSWIRIPFLEFITKTIMISKVRIDNHLVQYKQLNILFHFKDKIQYICNAVQLPENITSKNFNEPLQIIYVGRGTQEKRVHLVAEIAKEIKKNYQEITFTIVGDVGNAIPEDVQQYCILKGNINDEIELAKIYQEAHVLLITSNTEGFPMVVMEAMAYGCAIIATPVGDLPVHVLKENGFLTSSIDESVVVEEMTKQIIEFHNSKKLLAAIGNANILYAKNNFDIEIFNKNYEKILT